MPHRQTHETVMEWEEATSQYRDHLARKLQLDHPAKQRYSKTDIIVALDQIENEIVALR